MRKIVKVLLPLAIIGAVGAALALQVPKVTKVDER